MESESEVASEKRGPFDICADILSVLAEEKECRRTLLASKSHLDSRGIPRYIDFLLRNDLATIAASRSNITLRISEKGKKILASVRKVAHHAGIERSPVRRSQV